MIGIMTTPRRLYPSALRRRGAKAACAQGLLQQRMRPRLWRAPEFRLRDRPNPKCQSQNTTRSSKRVQPPAQTLRAATSRQTEPRPAAKSCRTASTHRDVSRRERCRERSDTPCTSRARCCREARSRRASRLSGAGHRYSA